MFYFLSCYLTIPTFVNNTDWLNMDKIYIKFKFVFADLKCKSLATLFATAIYDHLILVTSN